MEFLLRLLPLLTAGLLLWGCTPSAVGSYQSARTFDRALSNAATRRATDFEGVARNPVIVIHGFLGSRLADSNTGQLVWGRFGASLPEPDELRRLALPMKAGEPLRTLTSSADAVTILDAAEVQLAGFQFQLPGYRTVIDHLVESGYVDASQPLPPDKHFGTLYTFAYDWRRDLPENAARFGRFLRNIRSNLQVKYAELYHWKHYDVQFDVVAHSMGGLLARYYLMYGDQDLPADGESLPVADWRGAGLIDKLIVVGTPNDGYLDTLLELTGGLKLTPGSPVFPQGIIGTFPTYYQMLPGNGGGTGSYEDDITGKPLDLFDPALWEELNWGLADPANDPTLQLLLPEHKTPEERRAVALDHLRKCLRRARQFRRAMAVDTRPPDDVSLFLYAGDAVETAAEATVDRQTGKITVTGYGPGDGKVLGSSARFDLGPVDLAPFSQSPVHWQSVTHVSAAHMGLFSSEVFQDNVSYTLLMLPTEGQRHRFR